MSTAPSITIFAGSALKGIGGKWSVFHETPLALEATPA